MSGERNCGQDTQRQKQNKPLARAHGRSSAQLDVVSLVEELSFANGHKGGGIRSKTKAELVIGRVPAS